MFKVLERILKDKIATEPVSLTGSQRMRGCIEGTCTREALSECAKVCPVNAFQVKGTDYSIDYKKCIFCGKCVEACTKTILENEAQVNGTGSAMHHSSQDVMPYITETGERVLAEVLQEKLGTKNGENRPNAMILCYPVIRGDELTHQESIRWVSGCEPGTPGFRFWAAQDHVDSATCPAFVWHTVTDASVPVENSIAMISALQAHKIPFECHFFPEGSHGMSVCTEETSPDWPAAAYNRRWVDMSIQWLYNLFHYAK